MSKPLENQGERNNVLCVVFHGLSENTSFFQINELEGSLFLPHNSFMVKLKKNVLTESHKKNWAGQHSELLYWKSNGHFKSTMDLPLEE